MVTRSLARPENRVQVPGEWSRQPSFRRKFELQNNAITETKKPFAGLDQLKHKRPFDFDPDKFKL